MICPFLTSQNSVHLSSSIISPSESGLSMLKFSRYQSFVGALRFSYLKYKVFKW